MIPRVARRGHSFKGAGQYYLHDKQADTAERVAFTYTRNLPTANPQLALHMMIFTATHSADLKEASGIKAEAGGRQQSAGSVYSYSLSWHTEQEPDKAAMIAAANTTLERLGLSEHQVLIVAHNDTDHAHVHVIVNLVHPTTGKVAAGIRQDQRILSAWASEYEQQDGKIYCEERKKNAERRQQGELTKYQDEKVADAPSITQLYQQADNGSAFIAALEEKGYVVARGDKGRLVIVDDNGTVQNLVRQIDGVKKKDIEAKLGEVLQGLPSVAEAMTRLKNTENAQDTVYPDSQKIQQNTPDAQQDIDALVVSITPEGKAPALSEPIATLDAVHMAYVTKQRNVAPAPPVWGALPRHVQCALRDLQSVVVAELVKPRSGHDPLYDARTLYHMQRSDLANQEISEVEYYAGQEGQKVSAEEMPSSTGLKRYLDYAERHLIRFAQWVVHAPREYVDHWHRRICKRRHAQREDTVPERNIQANKSKISTMQREREIEQ